MKTKYRIVTDSYAGYEVQAWSWWWPFWTQCGFTNTHHSIESAEAYARELADPLSKVVKDLGSLR